jgi:uncharacterized protein (TIGR03086 family)
LSAAYGTVTKMTPRDEQFLAHSHRFTAVVEATADWSGATPCSEWTAGQLVDHVVDTQRDLLSQHGADLDARVAGAGGAVWSAHHVNLVRLAADDALMSTAYDGFFGPTTLRDTLATFYGFDLLVHGWDLSTSTAEPLRWTETEMDQIETSITLFGPGLYMEGICNPAIEVPADASRQSRILGTLGREG